MTFAPFSKIRVVMPGAASATAASPSYQSIAIPLVSGDNLSFQLRGTHPAAYLPTDATSQITVDPVSGANDGLALASGQDLNGLPYGATHINFVVFGTGSAVEFDLIFGTEI